MAPNVAAALGQDWSEISFVEAKTGKHGGTPAERTFFSRDLNQTVIVREYPFAPEVLTFAPTVLQPVISPAEKVEASELGRQWLGEQGIDIEGLEGFGIRALDNGELYPVRMVYVTYSVSWFEDPLFSALVDLTNGLVIEGGAL